MASRAICTSALAAFLVIATFAVVSYKENTGFIRASVGADDKKVDVLKNIINLKAYCLAAYDDARTTISQHHNLQSITTFVVAYGQEGGGDDLGGRKAEVGNIVTEYANVLAALHTKYGTGVNQYILNSLDHAIRHNPKGAIKQYKGMQALGNGGVHGRKYGHLVAVNYKALGLTDMPDIIVQMSVKRPKFLTFKTQTDKHAENADAIAATIFLQSKTFGRYTSFLQREIAKVNKKMRSEANYVAKAAYGAEQDAFKKAYEADRQAFFTHVAVQSGAGREAAKETAASMKWKVPTYDELKKIAAEHSKKFIEEFKKKNPDLLKTITEEASGCKLVTETTGASEAGSTMQPTVKFVGKLGEFQGKMRAVPGAGLSAVQHFPATKAVGEIVKVILIPEGGTDQKWNVASVKMQCAGQDSKMVPLTTGKPAPTFWLKSGAGNVEMHPDKAAASKVLYEKAQCRGWRGTSQCQGGGSRDADSDLSCIDKIDSSMSGYCECDTGHRAKMDCGHDTFTCQDICEA